MRVFSILEIRNFSRWTIFPKRLVFLIFSFGVFLFLFIYAMNPVPVTNLIWTLAPHLSANDFRDSTQEDLKLIYYIKHNLVGTPSIKPYNLTTGNREDHYQQSYMITYFKNKEKGTFIEVGAYDGEYGSVTLNLEVQKKWTGLLIEPNPISFVRLLSRNRKAMTIKGCLSDSRSPKRVSFKLSDQQSKIIQDTNIKDSSIRLTWCYPLYSLMVATNLTTVDLLSIDLEGLEISVLKTLPWEKVNIKAILIEYMNIPGGKNVVKNYMANISYSAVKDFGWDYFFVKNNKA